MAWAGTLNKLLPAPPQLVLSEDIAVQRQASPVPERSALTFIQIMIQVRKQCSIQSEKQEMQSPAECIQLITDSNDRNVSVCLQRHIVDCEVRSWASSILRLQAAPS